MLDLSNCDLRHGSLTVTNTPAISGEFSTCYSCETVTFELRNRGISVEVGAALSIGSVGFAPRRRLVGYHANQLETV